MDEGDRPWVVSADGLIVTVRLTPKAGRDSIDGIVHLSDGRTVLKARVSAAPSDGEAAVWLQALELVPDAAAAISPAPRPGTAATPPAPRR